jgi:hypothetical protein
VEFYNLKSKKTVEIANAHIRKRRSVRTTSGGKVQERYAAVAEINEGGTPMKLFKFVNKETFDRLDVPEVD